MNTLEDDIREADKLGISYGEYKRKQEELKMARGYKTPKEVSERVLRLAQDIDNYVDISRLTGVSRTTVRDIIKAAEKEKEPEAATTVPSSTANINVSTDIIPESTEKVKDFFIPDAVREACFRLKEDYQKEVKEAQSVIDGRMEDIRQIDEFLGRE